MKRLHTRYGYISADQVIDGVPVNPRLPAAFDDTPNDDRPDAHRKFWNVPYILIDTLAEQEAWLNEATDEYAEARRVRWRDEDRTRWLETWPSGNRYTVRCLDGGAWDRSTNWGSFATLAAALEVASAGPSWR